MAINNLTIRLDPGVRARLARMAARDVRSLGGEIEYLIEKEWRERDLPEPRPRPEPEPPAIQKGVPPSGRR